MAVFEHFAAAAAAAGALPFIGEEVGGATVGGFKLLAEAELEISQPGFNFGTEGGGNGHGTGAVVSPQKTQKISQKERRSSGP
jgi:hypothetical protein